MNSDDTTIHPEQSFDMISRMIHTAKNKLADDGFFFIFWGWLVFAAAIIHYFAWSMGIERGYLVWPVMMPLGAIVSVIYGYRMEKVQRVKTYIDTYLAYLWGAFIIAMLITLAFMPVHGMKVTYFFLMVLYGLGTFISGGLLSFRPLIAGSIFSFACAAVSVFVGEKEQLLCISAALLFSYIIPGHLLRAKYRSENV
jgi:hypothetical protein